MLYRRFGRTELDMPVFSCGGMRYQYKWQDVPLSDVPSDNQDNLEATIRRSLELGIHHIETARGYGSSEMQLGQVLPKFPREKLIIQTKVAPSHSGKEFYNTVEESLENLQLDHVDLLGIHGINTAELLDWTMRPGGCLDMARKLQAQGRVKFIGFSTHAPTEIMIRAIDTGEFDYVNLHWYYINQRNWSAIEAATRQDMGVFIISPTNKGGLLNQPSQKLEDLCKPLSPIAFNDIFCLSHPQIHTLSVGAARPSDFDEHIKALQLLHRAEELLPPILERLETTARDQLGQEWLDTWEMGLPTVDQTPGNVNIPVILWLRNLAIAYDMIDYAKMRYNLLGSGGHWFPGARVDAVPLEDLQACLAEHPQGDRLLTALVDTHHRLAGEARQRLSQE